MEKIGHFITKFQIFFLNPKNLVRHAELIDLAEGDAVLNETAVLNPVLE